MLKYLAKKKRKIFIRCWDWRLGVILSIMGRNNVVSKKFILKKILQNALYRNSN